MRLLRLPVVVTMLVLASTQVQAQPALTAAHAPAIDRTALQAAVDTIIADYAASYGNLEKFTAVSASVSLPGGEAPNINAAAGVTEASRDAATATPASLFQIGSITKSMTAVVVLQLVGEGVLSLDTPIGRWLPEYPAWRNVTLRRLLNMTSGIPGYDGADAFRATVGKWGLGRHFTPAQLVSYADPELPGAPAPTTGYDYSNTNFILAQMIIERATGRSYADEVDTRILGAGYGLDAVFYASSRYPDAVMARMVAGYMADPPRVLQTLVGQDMRHQDLSWAQGAGGAVASPEGVTEWARLLFTGAILNDSQRAEMMDLVSMKTGAAIADVTADDSRGFGLGVAKETVVSEGVTFWFYEGETMGFRMLYGYFPATDVVVAVGANSSGADADNLGPTMLALHQAMVDAAR